ncbi:MAG: DEAD/DEAH box helicase [Actinobacteria bacterium]|nr:DEAD/DEAH box helicase [Actinomycetota bacterium]
MGRKASGATGYSDVSTIVHDAARHSPRERLGEVLSTVDPTSAPTFAELGAEKSIVEALAADGIEYAFPIQQMCMALALEGKDLIGQAKTGTGKTLGFGIPLLQRLTSPLAPEYPSEPGVGAPHALVVCPTRELSLQVATDLERAGRIKGMRVLAIYGGRAYEPQIDALTAGIDVVVGTPGRIIDLATRGSLVLSHVRVLVLDEADEMLDMGFLPDVERIVDLLPTERQTMLFSATMPGQIVALARRYMRQPIHIRASEPGDDNATVDAIEQHVWRAHPMDKVELVARILQAEGRHLAMIFTRTKRKAQKIADELTERGFAVGAVHGDLGQGAREQALRAFRSGKVDVLVATDVAARGIDVDDVTHVVNYECPDDEKTYLHRIGRTGRAGASGVAVTLVDWEDVARWQMIDRALKLPFKDPIETYSTSEHVYAGLKIPAGTTGKLPKDKRTRAGLTAEAVEDIGETGKKSGKGRDKPKRPTEQRAKSERPREDREKKSKRPRQRTRKGEPVSGQ